MTDPVSPAQPPLRRLCELDALRGIAALAVTLFHFTYFVGDMFPVPRATLSFHYGWYGVQIFFAISGFVILTTLDRTRRAVDFIRARFWRLFPIYWLSVAITFVSMQAFGPPKLRTGIGDALANLTMLQLYLQPLADVRMVDGAYWSLNVEIVFYAAMLLAWRSGWIARIERVLIGWIALRWLWPWIPEAVQKPLLLDHIVFFAIGIGCYRIWAGQRSIAQQVPLLAWAMATVLVTNAPDMYPLTIGLIALFLAIATGRLRWLTWRPLRWLGGISYPLYLLHGSIGYAVIVRLDGLGAGADLSAAIALASCLMLAMAVSHGVERPLAAWVEARRERPLRHHPAIAAFEPAA